MSRQAITWPVLVGFAVFCGGCATLVSGTTQTVTIDSNPPGAFVRIGHQTGTTPVTLRMSKGHNLPVEVSRYSDRRVVELRRRFDPATLLNAIPPLWPGFIIDAVTGSMKRYDPEYIIVDFTQEPQPATVLTSYRVRGHRR